MSTPQPCLLVRYGAAGLEASGDGVSWFSWTPPAPGGVVYLRTSTRGLLEQSLDGRTWTPWLPENERLRNQKILAYCRDAAEEAAFAISQGNMPRHAPREIKTMVETALLLDGKSALGVDDAGRVSAEVATRRIPDFSLCTPEELEIVYQYGLIEARVSR